jgi:hypothetical protein
VIEWKNKIIKSGKQQQKLRQPVSFNQIQCDACGYHVFQIQKWKPTKPSKSHRRQSHYPSKLSMPNLKWIIISFSKFKMQNMEL